MCGALPQIQSLRHRQTVHLQRYNIHCKYASHTLFLLCNPRQGKVCFLKEKNNVDIGRIVSVWLYGFKSCASCSSINISSALHPSQVNNIHEMYLYSAAHYRQSTELHVTQWCILSDFNRHSEKPQMVTQLGYTVRILPPHGFLGGAPMSHKGRSGYSF